MGTTASGSGSGGKVDPWSASAPERLLVDAVHILSQILIEIIHNVALEHRAGVSCPPGASGRGLSDANQRNFIAIRAIRDCQGTLPTPKHALRV